MQISAIVAMSENRVIGINNKLPWHLKDDLQRFKAITMHRSIIMGRNTYESIGKPLPGRKNIIISRNSDFKAEGCIIVHSIEDAIRACENESEIFFIGGALIFRDILPRIDTLYLTLVHTNLDGDTFFPEINSKDWKEVEHLEFSADQNNEYDFSFIKLEKIN